MLVGQWILAEVGGEGASFERLCRALLGRAEDAGLDVSVAEIRVVLEKLIADGRVETCQFLAESQAYQATVYDDSNIHFYFFRGADGPAAASGHEERA